MLKITIGQDAEGWAKVMLGPYEVKRKDFGLQVVDGESPARRVVYQEKITVRANGRDYTTWVEVPQDAAMASGDVAVFRANELMKALEEMGMEIEKGKAKT